MIKCRGHSSLSSIAKAVMVSGPPSNGVELAGAMHLVVVVAVGLALVIADETEGEDGNPISKQIDGPDKEDK
ncbi:hypothetical protein AAC387_Pa10g1029 [Persea americana]